MVEFITSPEGFIIGTFIIGGWCAAGFFLFRFITEQWKPLIEPEQEEVH